MPQNRWTTEEEFAFLSERIPVWLEQREKGGLAQWVRTFFHTWVDEFGMPDITAEDLKRAKGITDTAKAAKRTWLRKVSFLV